MKSNMRFSLTQKVLFLCLSLLLACGFINAYQFNRTINSLMAVTSKNFEVYSDQLGKAVGAQFFERYGDVQAFAVNEVFQGQTKDAMVSVLNNYAALYGIYNLIIFVDLSGKVIAVNDKSPSGALINVKPLYEGNYANDRWFKDALAGQFLEDKAKNFLGTSFEDVHVDPLVSTVFGRSMFGTSFSAPVKDSTGKIIGIISNRADVKWLEVSLLELYDQLSALGYKQTVIQMTNGSGDLTLELSGNKEGQATFNRDDKVILKTNLKRQLASSPLVFSRDSGSDVFSEKSKDDSDLIGYSLVKGPKFIESLGWRSLVRIPETQAYAAAKKEKAEFFVFLVGIVIASSVIAFLFSVLLGRGFFRITSTLSNSAKTTFGLSERMNESAVSLAGSGQEQAAAIQESVAALNQMGSMIAQTGQSIRQGLDSAERTKANATAGLITMKELEESIESIKSTNSQLQNISGTIDSIGTKASLIHDIVFKTQLLSFNASIEAARAGVHGRGFAVVAEEMGNLALLSERAAKEIESMLSAGKETVRSTLDSVQQQVGVSVQVGQRAKEAFETISKDTENLEAQVRSINEATEQQEKGVQQSGIAMKQLDTAARNNTAASDAVLKSGNELKSQSRDLELVVAQLLSIVQGNTNTEAIQEPTIPTSSLVERFIEVRGQREMSLANDSERNLSSTSNRSKKRAA